MIFDLLSLGKADAHSLYIKQRPMRFIIVRPCTGESSGDHEWEGHVTMGAWSSRGMEAGFRSAWLRRTCFLRRRPDGEKVGVTREHPPKLRILFTRRVPRVFFLLRPLSFLPHRRRHQSPRGIILEPTQSGVERVGSQCL